MIFPLHTDRRLRHTPYANMLLIAINVVVFLAQMADQPTYDADRYLVGPAPWWYGFELDPANLHWYQFITYQFLHFDVWHIGGNMLFLWVFGNSVEDRLRPWGYIPFYLIGGIAAGGAHLLTSDASVLGASGAVAAITGAYLAMFPKTEIRLLLIWFFYPYRFDVPAMWFIAVNIGMNVFFSIEGGGGVAYVAHLGGYAYGFAIGMALLGLKVLPREPFDMPALIKHWNRRREFRELARRDYTPWQKQAADRMGRAADDPEFDELTRRRAAVSSAVAEHDGARAADAYQRLLDLDDTQTMSTTVQHDLGNLAAAAGRYAIAARAYERFLTTYPADAAAPEVQLMLGRIYMRYLDDRARAREVLTEARDRQRDPQRRELAEAWLTELGGA
ncbi:MAG: rhomboid family intramembrane serine protease [Phycisphaera sp.]|nr:rhomboid family intramembrane serine protease [Phycisphaera sp.]